MLHSLNDKQKRYAQNIQKSGRLLLDLINDILDLAKIEAGKMDLRLSEFRIEAVVTAQCDMVRALSEEKNIDLIREVEPDLPPLFQDQNKIQQVLINLLSNAIKFTPEGGRITVSVRRPGRAAAAVGGRYGRGDPRTGSGDHLREVPAEFADRRRQQPDPRVLGHGPGPVDCQGAVQAAGRRDQLRERVGKGQHLLRPPALGLPHPGFRQLAIDAQLDEIVESQRLASHPELPHLAPVPAGTP